MDRQSIDSIYGLSPLQRGMLFHSLYQGSSGAYFQQVVASLRGRLDIEAFRASWERIVERHPVLRSAIVWEKLDQPVQVVRKKVALPLVLKDWSNLDAPERQSRLQSLLAREREAGFKLEEAPLMRLILIRENAEQHRFVWNYHHLLLDGWSLALVLKEVFACFEGECAGRRVELAPSRPYRDYIAWLKRQDASQAEGFWREALKGFRQPTSLGVDYRTELDNRGASYREIRIRLSEEVTSSLSQLARRSQLTLNALVQGGWSILLGRYGGSDDVVFGATVSGRPPELRGVEAMVGLFINTLPMRVKLEPEAPLLEWLLRVQERLADMRQFEYSSLPDIRKLSEVNHGAGLFKSILVFENYPVDRSAGLGGSRLQVSDLSFVEQTHYPLTVLAVPDESLSLGIAFDTRRIDPPIVERMLAHLRRILEQIAQDPARTVGSVEMLSDAEKAQALRLPAPGPEAQACAHRAFEDRARRWPQALALISDEETLSYGELNRRANQLARHLARRGACAEQRVGICLQRSPRMIVAMLAVLKSGAAYVPLDPSYPPERLNRMIQDSGLKLVIDEAESRNRLSGLNAQLVGIDQDWPAIAANGDGDLACGTHPENIAYVLYTSGSTGQPKGVIVPHCALMEYALAMIEVLALGVGDRFLEFAPLSFDASVVQIFPTILSGAALNIHRNVTELSNLELLRLCEEQRLTILDLPAAFWHQWLDDLDRQGESIREPLRFFLTGGESSFGDNLRTWARLAPPASRFLSSYGPTETTVAATIFETDSDRVSALPFDRLPLGSPLRHAGVFVLDRNLRPTPSQVTGAIYVGGRGVSRGYLNRPRLTAERFLPDPFSPQPGMRLYSTGDLARVQSDGRLEFRGREDGQIKLRGFRVETSEIETALARHPDLKATVVTLSERPSGKDLVAYIVPKDGTIPDNSSLRRFLADRLPDFMLPSFFVPLERLPVSRNGKIDRKALPAPDLSRPELTSSYVQPQTELEQVLAEIWSSVLGVERVGRDDSFFELGGHSLSATQLVSRLREFFHVELPLAALFDQPTISGLAQRLEATLKNGSQDALEPIRADGKKAATAPLSLSQQRLWFLDQLSPGDSVYNLPVRLQLRGPLDFEALERSFREIVQRHEILRTTFDNLDGEPIQRIHPESLTALTTTSLSHLSALERQEEIERLSREDGRRPFDLAAGPLLRAQLLQLTDEDHILLMTMHHIVSDGWSMGILIRELGALYEAHRAGAESALAPLAVQYRDFARWQRRNVAENRFEASLQYWRSQLGDPPPGLDLPCDRPRPAAQSFDGARESIILTPQLTRALNQTGRKERVTLFMLLLAAFKTLLYRYSGQSDMAVGSPVANRTRKHSEALIGFFLNTLVLRTSFSGDWSFRRLLDAVRGTAVGAYAHQDVPFEGLLETLQPERDMSATPFFQVLFNMLNFADNESRIGGLSLKSLPPAEDRSKFDLTLFAEESQGRLHLDLVYSSDLFEAASAARMLTHYRRILEAVVDDPNVRLARIHLIDDAEWSQAASFARAGQANAQVRIAEPALDHLVDALFRRHAQRHSDRLALQDAKRRWTYGRLEREADQLSRKILDARPAREERVALLFDHGVAQSAGMLAALRCGKAYVPLDPAYPLSRLRYMLRDSQAGAIVAGPGNRQLAHRLSDGLLQVIEYDPDRPQPQVDPVRTRVSPDAHAYLLYTSGSTGQPKGAIQSQRNLLHHIRCYADNLRISCEDRLTLLSSYSFDAAVMDIYGALLTGAALFPYDLRREGFDSLAEMLIRERISIYHSTPTVYRHFLDALSESDAFPHLRMVVLGGEEVVGRDVARFRRRFSRDCTFINGFGPTESTLCLQFPIESSTPASGRRVPIGFPVQDTEISLLDESGREIADLGVGEIAIRSRYLALGYWNKPELTSEAFSADPHDPRLRTYRTGDIGRRRFDGALEYLGRIDSQIKIRGFRIEASEVEAALNAHPDIEQSLVVAWADAAGESRLAAYLIGADSGLPSDRELRSHLADRLPDYMIPTAYVEMESFPLTPTGKLQRNRLPAPSSQLRSPTGRRRLPRDPLEEMVAAAWAEVLKRDDIAIDDNFFDLGGHSLLATQVISRLRKRFEVDLPLRSLFEDPTVAAVAEAVRQARSTDSQPRAARIGTVAKRTGLPLSFAQQRLWFLDQVDPGNPAYIIPAAVELKGPLDRAILEESINEIVRRHEILRVTFSKGQDGPNQNALDRLELELPLVDLSRVPEAERREAARAEAIGEAALAFDLERGPLLRTRLLKLAQNEFLLLLSIHHIVSDGWSMGVLVSELATVYKAFSAGQPSPLHELPIQYADYANWQRRQLRGEVLQGHLAYWRSHLGEDPSALQLHDTQPVQRTNKGARWPFQLSSDLSRTLKSLAQEHGATLYMTLLAAFETLLHRVTGQEDFVIGTAIANRNRQDVEPLIGFFVNMLPLRSDLSGHPTFAQLLQRVRRSTLGSYTHQDLPFEKLVKELQPKRSLDRNPLFQVFFGFLTMPEPDYDLGDLRMRRLDLDYGYARFDLSLFFSEKGDALEGVWLYSPDLFDAVRIEQLSESLIRLLGLIATAPQARIGSYDLFPDQAAHRSQASERLRKARLRRSQNRTAFEKPGPAIQ